jgi:hypothetical protein
LLVLVAYLNLGTTGALIRGGGSGATLAAFPNPLGSTATLFNPPAFAGPRAMPLIGTFPDAARPAMRANEAVGAAARTAKVATTIFFELFDMAKLHCFSLEHWMREADLARESAGTIKMKFRERFSAARWLRAHAPSPKRLSRA